MKKLSLALLLASPFLFSCSLPSKAPSCADKVAIAFTTSVATPGIWNCFDAYMQGHLQGHDDSVLAGASAFNAYHQIAASDEVVVYELTINMNDPSVQAAISSGVSVPPHATLTVWVDVHGKIGGFNVGLPQ
jgi:hypothetical protein